MALAPAQQLQRLADIRLDEQYCNTAGTHETAGRANGYGYHTGSQLMQAASATAAAAVGTGSAAGKPMGIPVKPDELQVYAQRVMRPGQVQQFGVVLLVAFIPRAESTASAEEASGAEADAAGTTPSPPPLEAGEARATPSDDRWCTILAASANSADVLGVGAGTLIDSEFFDPETSPFEDDTLASLRRTFESNDLAVQAPLVGTMRHVARKAFLILHRTEEGIVIDIEPIDEDVGTILQGSLHTHSLAKRAVSRLQHLAGSNVAKQCQATVEEVQKLTGYDRVMIYKFHPDCHGEVVAEVMSRRVPDSMHGLHFPATDIPQANRNIFMTMRSRMIADVARPSVKVLRSLRLPQNIILAGSQLRGVTGCHAQYLQNMGVQATLVLSIVTSGTTAAPGSEGGAQTGSPPPRSPLWGLLVCHHYGGPYRVNYDHRAAVEFLIKVFSLQLGRCIDAEIHQGMERVARMQTAICDILKVLDEPGNGAENFSKTLGKSLFHDPHAAQIMLQVADCAGCAMILDDVWHVTGKCPPTPMLDELLTWLTSGVGERRKLQQGGHWGTISLAKDGYPQAAGIRRYACGVLAVDLLQSSNVDAPPNRAQPETGYILWMRGEMMHEQTWAGDRHSAPARAMGHEMSPRASFEAMKELVELECSPWTAAEVEGTHAVKLLLQDAIRLCAEGEITSRILIAINKERLRNMDELTKVANELQAVIRTADVPIIKLDRSLNVVDFNKHAEHFFEGSLDTESQTMLAIDTANPTGHPFADYIDPDSIEMMKETLTSAIDDGVEPEAFQVRFRAPKSAHSTSESNNCATPTASSHDFTSETKCIPTAKQEVLLFVHLKRQLTSGQVDQLVLVCRDMSTQANLMREVSARERDCEELMEHSSSAMFCVDTEGRINGWNAAMEHVSGVQQKSALGRDLLGEVLGPQGILVNIPYGNNKDAMTELYALLVNVLGLQNKPSLPPTAAPELLAKLSALQEAAGDTAADAVAGDPEKGTEEVDATGDPSLEPEQMPSEMAPYLGTQHQGSDPCINVRFIKAGSQRNLQSGQVDVAISCRRRVGAVGEVVGAFFFVQDMTLPKALEKAIAVQMAAEAAAEAKTRHIAFLCHEIRNPVNGILATVQAIEDLVDPAQHEGGEGGDTDNSEMLDLVRTTLACTDQLRRTVDGILDLNKMEEGKLELQKTSFYVPNILRTVLNQIISAASEKGLALDAEVRDPKLRGTRFLGDEVRIQQILANFCWNSVKFTAEGGLRIEVEAEKGSAPGLMRLFWKVIDTGKGMTQQTQESLFERFAMGKHKVGKYGGSGLGLSICRSLAELMNGHLHCMSTLGQGSTFILELELELDDDPDADDTLPGKGIIKRSKSRTSFKIADGDEWEEEVEQSSAEVPAPKASRAAAGSADTQPPPAVQAPLTHAWPAVPAGVSGSAGIPGGCGVTVVREVVENGSVGVLVEVTPAPGALTRQFWGGAVIGPGGIGAALAEAMEDALSRLRRVGGVMLPIASAPSSPLLPDYTAAGQQQLFGPAAQQEAGNDRIMAKGKPARRKSVERSKAMEGAQVKPAPAAAGPGVEGIRSALVVDDDSINLKVLNRALSRSGVNVTLGEDGQDIIRLIINEGKTFDVVLVDENMRHMNGSTAVRALRKHETKNNLQPLPVFATTGNSAPHDLARYFGCGLDGMFTKPINMRGIVEALASYIKYRNAHFTAINNFKSYGASLMALPDPREGNDASSGPTPQVRDTETFKRCLVFGGLEVFGEIRESMHATMVAESLAHPGSQDTA